MRALISLILIIVTETVTVSYVSYSPEYELSGRLWESHEVIFNQNENIATSDSNRFISVKTQFTVLFINDGKFTASMKSVVTYQNGIVKSFVRELAGSWVTQNGHLDMNLKTKRHVDQQTVMGLSSEEALSLSIDRYGKILLEQTYLINDYKGHLILVSSHIGGPMLTLTEKKL
ncbi:hypothetical protein [Vibrio jasicida]|uniref:hypothetical protein n=1 Tax=Vibrio jasicida TaxID=766224 RepID=UPI000CE3D4D0|nr:hypothetical protein [Vibrio jasicida]